MKKFLAVICMITCIFGLTACGKQESVSSSTESNIETAKMISTEFVIPYLSNFFDDAIAEEYLKEYDKEEMEYIAESLFSNVLSMYTQYGYEMNMTEINVKGSGILSGITSFNSAYDSIGDIVEIGEPAAEISGDEIIVNVPVTGRNKNANAEIIFSNDIFLKVEACALNVDSTMGELMVRAALNTLLGMGTVFTVLILISLIISCLGIIPKLQARRKNKAAQENKMTAVVDNTIAQIIEKEEAIEEVNATDDFELVAVIAAAIAAGEGAASTDGFVVRSIRKVRR